MRILVTGGTGFTGSALVERLLGQGHQVVVLDTSEGERLTDLREAGAEIRFGSVTDPEVVSECMEGVDAVHHVAATFRDIGASDSHYVDVNVSGTEIVLDAALRAGVRKFVYCSTCGVHGNVENPPADEDAIGPADFYQETKYRGELRVQEYARRGLETVILRPCALYGRGDPGRFLMIFRQVQKGFFPMFGRRNPLYHTVYIENFVDACLLAMEPGRGAGRAYLVADEECPSIEELVRLAGDVLGVDVKIWRFPLWPLVAAGHVVEKACKPLGISPPIYPRRVDWFRQTRAFNIDRAKRELGYRPRFTLREGLEETAGWYRRHGWLP